MFITVIMIYLILLLQPYVVFFSGWSKAQMHKRQRMSVSISSFLLFFNHFRAEGKLFQALWLKSYSLLTFGYIFMELH